MAPPSTQAALRESRIEGLETNLRWLRDVLRDDSFAVGTVSTRLLDTVPYAPRSLQIVSGGTATTVQDWPGREGLWSIGVPPSGPMDDRSFRLGNLRLGNLEGTAGLEITFTGPTIRFNTPARLCLTGADFGAKLDGEPVALHTPFDIAAGQTLARAASAEACGYLLAGGLISPHPDSQSTFELGRSADMPHGDWSRATHCISPRQRPTP